MIESKDGKEIEKENTNKSSTPSQHSFSCLKLLTVYVSVLPFLILNIVTDI